MDQCSRCQADAAFPCPIVRAATLYTEPLRSAIHAFKYESQPELALFLARYLVAVFQQPPWADLAASIDCCLPVPIHPQRERERGFNQSALLASAFGNQVGVPVEQGWVWRSRETQSQARLSAVERRQNVAGAFTASPEVAGKQLLLIDDVLTTGATMTACARALVAAGAATVYGLVLSTPPWGADDGLRTTSL